MGYSAQYSEYPITFPPEKFRGLLLSAMCVPDLKGSQGTFFYYSTDPAEKDRELSGGIKIPMEKTNGIAKSYISGPENSMLKAGGEMQIPFQIRNSKNGSDCELVIDKNIYSLKLKEYTPYINIDFKPGLGVSVRGLVKFYLIEKEPYIKLYMTPYKH